MIFTSNTWRNISKLEWYSAHIFKFFCIEIFVMAEESKELSHSLIFFLVAYFISNIKEYISVISLQAFRFIFISLIMTVQWLNKCCSLLRDLKYCIVWWGIWITFITYDGEHKIWLRKFLTHFFISFVWFLEFTACDL